jgi:hypothetical protein
MATRRNEADTRGSPADCDPQLRLARTTIAGLLAAAYRRFAAAQPAPAELVAQSNQAVASPALANQGLANSERSSVHGVVL